MLIPSSVRSILMGFAGLSMTTLFKVLESDDADTLIVAFRDTWLLGVIIILHRVAHRYKQRDFKIKKREAAEATPQFC